MNMYKRSKNAKYQDVYSFANMIRVQDFQYFAQQFLTNRCVSGPGHFGNSVRLGFCHLDVFLLWHWPFKCATGVYFESKRKTKVQGKVATGIILNYRFYGSKFMPKLVDLSWIRHCYTTVDNRTILIEMDYVVFSYNTLSNEVTMNFKYRAYLKNAFNFSECT